MSIEKQTTINLSQTAGGQLVRVVILDPPNAVSKEAVKQMDTKGFRAAQQWPSKTRSFLNFLQRGSQATEPLPGMKWLKRVAVVALGGTVLAIGVAMIVLPGPAFIVIPAGLAILAIEFVWARRWLRSVRAVLPRFDKNRPLKQKIKLQSAWRSLNFLFRRLRRTRLGK